MEYTNINYEDIADFICKSANIQDTDKKNDISEALYNLEIICKNSCNFEYWRTFYGALIHIAENN